MTITDSVQGMCESLGCTMHGSMVLELALSDLHAVESVYPRDRSSGSYKRKLAARFLWPGMQLCKLLGILSLQYAKLCPSCFKLECDA